MNAIELLVPAKDLESGKIAINYGADAVYIGANKFGARAAASNSIQDIAKLVKYARKYKAKVFVTLNTILYENELKEAEKLIWDTYNAGVNALIIQDLGILKMNIPPISLHASTQTNNFEPERIMFLDKLGFQRIILARELSLEEIKKIRKQTKTELEFFIHGALCVSLSGQCYFSQAISGKSANRGVCAQMCRHTYNLLDATGKKIVSNKHLLSLKDLNLSNHLQELIHAGISSLKIEGRLKDKSYIKNVVSYYRQKLDAILASDLNYTKASSGRTKIGFVPDPEKSFNRQSTDYFLFGRKKKQINPFTPKSMGKKIGKVTRVFNDYVSVNTSENLHNGDGLCFIFRDSLVGVRLEKVKERKLFLSDLSKISSGVTLFRNYDHAFTKLTAADKSVRKIDAHISIAEENNRLVFTLTDEDKLSSVHKLAPLPDVARNAQSAKKNIISQLTKSGNSIFNILSVEYLCEKAYFFRTSSLNEMRRTLFHEHEKLRIAAFAPKDFMRKSENENYPKKDVSFTENIANTKAEDFYKEHGVEHIEKALETSTPKPNQLLMTTRYCIKYELGWCAKLQKAKNTPQEPLFLEDYKRKYKLDFDCTKCMMQIRLQGKNL